MMTEKDLLRIAEAMKEAEKDETPFQVTDNGETSVVGDPNKINRKSVDISILFRFPSQFLGDMADKATMVSDGKYGLVEMEYKDISIRAEDDIPLVSQLMVLEPFLVEVFKDGNSEYRTEEELTAIVRDNIANRKIVSAIYNFTGIIAGVDEDLIPFMYYESVFEAFIKIITSFPEILNETYFFTARQWLETEKNKKAVLKMDQTD